MKLRKWWMILVNFARFLVCSQYHPMYSTKLLQFFCPIHLPSAQDSKSPANVARFDSHTFQLNERSIEATRRLGFFLIDARGCNYIIPWINPTLETFATESLQQLVPSCDMAKSFRWGQATNFCESIESLDPKFQQLHVTGTCGFHHIKRRKLSSSQSRSQHRPLGIATSCRVQSWKRHEKVDVLNLWWSEIGNPFIPGFAGIKVLMFGQF